MNSLVSSSSTRVHSLVRKAGTFELCFILLVTPHTRNQQEMFFFVARRKGCCASQGRGKKQSLQLPVTESGLWLVEYGFMQVPSRGVPCERQIMVALHLQPGWRGGWGWAELAFVFMQPHRRGFSRIDFNDQGPPPFLLPLPGAVWKGSP